MIHSKDFDFSFSGLKTAVLYLVKSLSEKKLKKEETKTAICAEFQQAVIDVLVTKILKATKKYKVKTILCGGGVMANKELRDQITEATQKEIPEAELRIPPFSLCTDNAVMIGIAGYFKFLKTGADKIEKIKADSSMNV